ncbi:hypothetical protein N0V85_001529 [Neurospora sp. IMI 360204]|nr:hypothetical protein N0V85_001529 [Neurospora sp. IMI 360204]
MQLSSTLALLASYFGLATAIHLPDGVWEGTTLANGTYSIKPAGAPDSESFLVEPTTQKRSGAPVAKEGMMAYYCIDAPRSSGNLDVDDVNYALEQMDATCQRYEASYFKWDGSVEIVGKGRSGDNVCV